MERIRTAAAGLAIVAALLAILFAYIGAPVSALFLAAAAGLLAMIAPFEAYEPAARTRVVVACMLSTLAVVGGVIWAVLDDSPASQIVGLAAQALATGLLAAWALKTRKRRRLRTGIRAYYDS